jgi:hypothetical protein
VADEDVALSADRKQLAKETGCRKLDLDGGAEGTIAEINIMQLLMVALSALTPRAGTKAGLV